MKYKTIILLFILVSFKSQENDFVYPDFQAKMSKAAAAKWKILKKTIGDINQDGIQDMAVIYETRDSVEQYRCTSEYKTKIPARVIAMYLNDGIRFKKILQNNDFIARADEGGMLPFLEPEISISKNELLILFQYTRSNTSYSFKLLNDSLRLISAFSGGVSSPGAGSTEFNTFDFIKKWIIQEKGFVYSDTSKTDTIRFHIDRLKTLNELKCMYTYEVIPDFDL
jgi:hypothetical protein